jgi:hypothetical protein
MKGLKRRHHKSLMQKSKYLYNRFPDLDSKVRPVEFIPSDAEVLPRPIFRKLKTPWTSGTPLEPIKHDAAGVPINLGYA